MSEPYTPGPWSLSGPPYDSIPWMHIYGPTDPKTGVAHHIMHRDRSEEEKIANARLIAASPALYAAAEKALNFITNTESELGITLNSGDALRSALKLARGEGPPVSSLGEGGNG